MVDSVGCGCCDADDGEVRCSLWEAEENQQRQCGQPVEEGPVAYPPEEERHQAHGRRPGDVLQQSNEGAAFAVDDG